MANCLKQVIETLWQSEEFAAAVLGADPTRPSAFQNTQRYKDLIKDHPRLASEPGTLFCSLYYDFFEFFQHS